MDTGSKPLGKPLVERLTASQIADATEAQLRQDPPVWEKLKDCFPGVRTYIEGCPALLSGMQQRQKSSRAELEDLMRSINDCKSQIESLSDEAEGLLEVSLASYYEAQGHTWDLSTWFSRPARVQLGQLESELAVAASLTERALDQFPQQKGRPERTDLDGLAMLLGMHLEKNGCQVSGSNTGAFTKLLRAVVEAAQPDEKTRRDPEKLAAKAAKAIKAMPSYKTKFNT